MDWDFEGGGFSVLYTIVYVLDIDSWHFAFIELKVARLDVLGLIPSNFEH